MQNYVALYGFLRTIFLVFIIFTWAFIFYASVSNINFSFHIALILIAFSFTSYISFLAFMKFYRRFNLEALMAISVVYNVKAPAKPE